MTDVADTPLPSQLWKQLSAERKLEAADAFWRDENAAAEQAELLATIALRIKFRTKSVAAMPQRYTASKTQRSQWARRSHWLGIDFNGGPRIY